jgi:hypothetical protein
MSQPILNNCDKTLTINKKTYKVRYYTVDTIVCETDELQGKFGDQFPLNLVIIIH